MDIQAGNGFGFANFRGISNPNSSEVWWVHFEVREIVHIVFGYSYQNRDQLGQGRAGQWGKSLSFPSFMDQPTSKPRGILCV